MSTRIRTRLTKLSVAATAAVVLSIVVSMVALAATVINGGFETGTFAGWTVVNQSGSTAGSNWYNYTGTTSPDSSHPIPAPPQGIHAAITDQTGRGSHELYQDITLQPGFTHSLTFTYYYHAYFALTAPGTLDYTVGTNMQYRIDVMKTTAADFSIAPADVLANIFQTKVGDPLVLAPTASTFNLTPFAGQTIRLRFAEADNASYFNAGVDNVTVTSNQVTTSTATALTSSSNPSKVGQAVTYTATVAPTPNGGTVAFTDNGATLTGCGVVAVNTSTGKATCSVTYSSAGSHSISAHYSGDAAFRPSTSGVLAQSVVAAASTVPVPATGAIPPDGGGPGAPWPLTLIVAGVGMLAWSRNEKRRRES